MPKYFENPLSTAPPPRLGSPPGGPLALPWVLPTKMGHGISLDLSAEPPEDLLGPTPYKYDSSKTAHKGSPLSGGRRI